MESRLNIHSVWWTVHHKVNLQLLSDKLAILVLATKFNQSDINIISTATKFVIDNVFHNVRFFLLTIVGSAPPTRRPIILRDSTP